MIKNTFVRENKEYTFVYTLNIKMMKDVNYKKLKLDIKELSANYTVILKEKVSERIGKMKKDDKSHYLIYRVLGITDKEGDLIDINQNKGRFLYKYAGAFLEQAAFLCFKYKFHQAQKLKIPNTLGSRPKTFEIDCAVGNMAHEIKWRDATTDGDHITKEHTRIKAIKDAGYTPVRIMFYYPNRKKAQKIQNTLATLYSGVQGYYYSGDEAWEYILQSTGVNLKEILLEIANNESSLGE
ncbi:ApaLI-like restriction endonuclease [Anaerobacterium chartisolvens]|uniref:ApaLI-like restriction endonuclease n=1 Tax=Anaerobacterium chartisolvens TaxID=1297424 RepID=A0A369B9P6_9FIRM|nr:ApaLI family restriction endonuclease [Anaerobacterium chartisolvens]RCX17247.1 ApaLI-like restriction endonuclease [Anaerobacterium chartisolvens]